MDEQNPTIDPTDDLAALDAGTIYSRTGTAVASRTGAGAVSRRPSPRAPRLPSPRQQQVRTRTRPRARGAGRPANRRTTGPRAGPSDDDGPGESPGPALRLATPPKAIYTYAVLPSEQRGAES